MKTLLFDILLLAGIVGLLYGLHQAWPPLAWIIGGGSITCGTLIVWITQERAKKQKRIERSEERIT